MSHQKVVVRFQDRNKAHQAAAYLEELFFPTPDAVTVFEYNQGCGQDQSCNWQVEAYFGAADATADLQTRLSGEISVAASDVDIEDIPDLNWVRLSQEALPPVHAGRFTIFGSHDKDRIANGPNAILIDAGEAFGTAHHATTYGCLLAIDRICRRQSKPRVLDLGCGSAVLSIAMARALPRSKLLASDVDHQSVIVASDNVRNNRCGKQIQTLVAFGLNHKWLRKPAQFDIIIANILAGPLMALAPDLAHAITPKGQLILSGILNHQGAAIQARYVSLGFYVKHKMQINGWTTFVLMKRT